MYYMAKKKEEKEVKEEKKTTKKNDDVVEKVTEEKNDNTKKSKKGLIIIIVVLSFIILVLLGVVGYFVYRNSLENKTTGSSWSDIYYKYLKEQAKSDKTDMFLKKKSDITFVKTKGEKLPMMVVRNDDKCDGAPCKAIYVYGIVDDKVEYFSGNLSQNAEVKLYYNIERKEYNYYLHTKNDYYDQYTSLDTMKYDYENYNSAKVIEEKGIKYDSEEASKIRTEYYDKQMADTNRDSISLFKDDQKVVQKKLDGGSIEYNTIDEKLVDTEVTPEYFDYKQGMDVIKLRDGVVEEKKEVKDVNELLNKAIEKIVKEQIELIEKTKQDIEQAKAEIKADEERKAREAEEAEIAKGLTVGNNNLKYGTYTTSVPHGGIDGSDLYGTLTLKPHGKFHIKTNFEQSSGEARNIDEDGTYTTGTSMNSYSRQATIFFTTNSGYKFSFFVTNSSYMNSQWIKYEYSGN